MRVMEFRLENVNVIPVDKKNELHKNGIWSVKKENLDYTVVKKNFISYENHSKWWEKAFEKEYIYIMTYKSDICGYIRLTKIKTQIKEKNEISLALAKKYQNKGIGTYAYKIFEDDIRKKGITKIIAITDSDNKAGKMFFENNGFIKDSIKETFIKYVKKI